MTVFERERNRERKSTHKNCFDIENDNVCVMSRPFFFLPLLFFFFFFSLQFLVVFLFSFSLQFLRHKGEHTESYVSFLNYYTVS